MQRLHDVEIKETQSVELCVELTSSDVESIRWQKDGELLDQKTDQRFSFRSSGTKHYLSVKCATVHHEGEYVASVGEQECSCELTVIELPPEFLKQMELELQQQAALEKTKTI